MGRAKVAMEYIKKDRPRNTTFEKRKKGLKKKAQELATLCDVPLCMIIYQGPNSEPDTFPTNQEDVRSIIDRYASIPREENAKRSVNLQDVLDSKKRKADRQLSKLQNNNNKLHDDDDYGTWLPVLDGCTKEELSVLASILHNKMQAVDKRIGNLRATTVGNYNAIVPTNGGFGPSGCSYYDPNVWMGGPNEFYHPHPHGVIAENGSVFGGGGAGGSGMPQPLAGYGPYGGSGNRFEPHQMQTGGHKWYGNC